MMFYAARLSFNKPIQKSLQKKESDIKPIILAEKLLVEKAEYIKMKNKKMLKMYVGNFLWDNEGKLLAFRIGREKKREKHTYSESSMEFRREDDEDYPNVIVYGLVMNN
jgi:hypothetical protein